MHYLNRLERSSSFLRKCPTAPSANSHPPEAPLRLGPSQTNMSARPNYYESLITRTTETAFSGPPPPQMPYCTRPPTAILRKPRCV
ncbi:hypothetical protein CEXT_526741 [Caerostris extrusa]|uniref:Uncharacterized protein n=1 Tax=Caerostris extrusa TaxID=172846 RepID=A0AAV4MV04_CAEEX|nr:hypothetical protein CEXT_526741 [Caerostris extrusa]